MVSVTHQYVELAWDAPEDGDGLTGYQVLRRVPGLGESALSVHVDDTGSTSTTYTDQGGIAQGERHVYRVKARFGEETGPWSNYVRAEAPSAPPPTPTPTPEPAAPTGLTATPVAHDSVTLSWDDPGDDSITGYQVLRRSRDGDEYGDGEGAAAFVAVVDNTGTAATSYTDTSVTARTRYVYRVNAINSAGMGPRSTYLNVETSERPATVDPPAKPTGLKVSSVTQSSVSLTWDDPDDDSITHYQVFRRVGKQGSFTLLDDNTESADNAYTDSTVQAETVYEYRVAAVNSGGTSTKSVRVETTTPKATNSLQGRSASVPAKPTGLAVSAATDVSVSLSWDDPDDSSITHYKVLRREGDSGVFTTIAENTGDADTSYTDTTVSADTGYEYRVVAVNAEGASPESDSLAVTTPPQAAAVVVGPPEEEEPPTSSEQQMTNIVDKGTIEVDTSGRLSFTQGTINQEGERHRYTVTIPNASRFIQMLICESRGYCPLEPGFSLRLLDSGGMQVQDHGGGRNVVSHRHRVYGHLMYVTGFAGGTYIIEVRASDDRQTGSYALNVTDKAFSSSSPDEGSGPSNDFELYSQVGFLAPGDSVEGKLNTDGHERGVYSDIDFFVMNLQASFTYEITVDTSNRRNAPSSGALIINIKGPNLYTKTFLETGQHDQTLSFTPAITGRYVLSFGIIRTFGQSFTPRPTGDYTVSLSD